LDVGGGNCGKGWLCAEVLLVFEFETCGVGDNN